ncbi:MAG: outer membrane beta-barrel protein [Candidatus Aminicenantes bacterium]|nr:MAG: outer membrane beta-barrel protein [Candidatus Aminicenantes bacterium]
MNIKKTIIFLLFIAIYFCLFAKGSGLYLKITGGANFLNSGDFKELIKNNEIYYSTRNDESAQTNIYTSKHPFFWGFVGEMGYDFGKIAIGIETGYIERTFTVHMEPAETYSGPYIQTFSSIPVLLNFHYKMVNSAAMNAYVTGGLGIYLGKFISKYNLEYLDSPDEYINFHLKSTGNSPGFHVGVTLDYSIAKHLALVLETRYRLVNFKNMSGKATMESSLYGFGYTDEGDLYYIVRKSNQAGQFYVGTDYDTSPYDIKEAELNLNGLALAIGFKVRL